MKQIPNIEDLYTKIDDYYRNNFDESQPRKKMFITELLHHQLQKAREESVKALKVADNDIPPFPSAKDSESARIGFITGVAWARTRLHSELDQDNK